MLRGCCYTESRCLLLQRVYVRDASTSHQRECMCVLLHLVTSSLLRLALPDTAAEIEAR
jgi:hypothetical protein